MTFLIFDTSAATDPLVSLFLDTSLEATTASPIVSLVLVVVNSILEVFFLCLVGWILAYKGIIDEKAKKTLNKMNVNLFTPALLFSKVAFTLTPEKLQELFVIPIGFVLISSFSAAVAYLLGTVFRLKVSISLHVLDK